MAPVLWLTHGLVWLFGSFLQGSFLQAPLAQMGSGAQHCVPQAVVPAGHALHFPFTQRCPNGQHFPLQHVSSAVQQVAPQVVWRYGHPSQVPSLQYGLLVPSHLFTHVQESVVASQNRSSHLFGLHKGGILRSQTPREVHV